MSKVKDGELAVELIADKVTKGSVRFMETGSADWPLNVYLRKEQVAELGLPLVEGSAVTLTLTPVK